MSAPIKKQNQGYPPNADRAYGAAILVEFIFPDKLHLEKLKQSLLEVECSGTWGRSRVYWQWILEEQTVEDKHFGDKWGHSVGTYMIEPYCYLKHSQLHAFENFVIDFEKRLEANFPGQRVGVQLIFRVVLHTIK